MVSSSSSPVIRWLGALAAGGTFLAALLGMAGLYMKFGVVNHFVQEGMQNGVILRFVVKAVLVEILPLYLGIGFVLFFLGMVVTKALGLWSGARDSWTFRHAFWATTGLLAFVHAILWFRVPTTLWVLLGINKLPMGVALGLIFLAALWGMWSGLGWERSANIRRVIAMGAWCLIAWGSLWLPARLEQLPWERKPVGHSVRALLISNDGTRQDTAFEEGFGQLHGFKIVNGYTAIPATRLQWSILWGGNPRLYSAEHLFPSLEELEGKAPYEILEKAKAEGLKSRFYIDDGGTVGLTDRTEAFDRVLMPAPGWENFLNSNMAVHVPLYAAWLNVLRIFPTTTPWTPLDLGLRAALSDGRGADWVMYHSCLSHQPIFLNRKELKSIPGWWRFPAAGMAPIFGMPSPSQQAAWRPQYSPYLAYQIRIRDIIHQWGAIWNQLPNDPDYGPATRLFMTDHGERFYHATDAIQMGGVHGYSLDPWECRIPLVVDGPGLPSSGTDSTHAVSLLTVRDLLAKRVLENRLFGPEDLTKSDHAFMRMEGINFWLNEEYPHEFREMDPAEMIEGTRVLPNGAWAMKFKQPLEVREQNLLVGEATGNRLVVYRPFSKGGAREYIYQGYTLISWRTVSEADYQKVRKQISDQFLVRWDATKEPGN